ncbi:hypothetical protein RUND412_004225 [Rhizina undulata]
MIPSSTPSSIIILGSGVFGLTAALSLALRPRYKQTEILVLDRLPFPVPDGSSIDSSRVIRADYADPLYSDLGSRAQVFWRGEEGSEGLFRGELKSVYYESGLVIVCDPSDDRGYVDRAVKNVGGEGEKVRVLKDLDGIREACGTGGACGGRGYVNWGSGWANAEGGMKILRARCEETGRVRFVVGEVGRFIFDGDTEKDKDRVIGVGLKDGGEFRAGLVIAATGAWTPGLVDLGGRAVATGQVLGYVNIPPEIEEELKDMPVILNISSGLFVLPPRNGVLKVARHDLGYLNTSTVRNASGNSVTTSVPKTAQTDPSLWIPREGEEDLLRGLKEMVPVLGERVFDRTRLCWYTDTPTADFIVDYHPDIKGLFIATGGSGHAYKFLPVLGEEIVDVIEGKGIFKEKWRWREGGVEEVVTRDGSRGGVRQLELAGLEMLKRVI